MARNPRYQGNKGNLLQHWVLVELVRLLQQAVGPSGSLCFIDAHAMSPYAQRKTKPKDNKPFDRALTRLFAGPPASYYEEAWRRLVEQHALTYPTSAAFVRDAWPGQLHMILCERDEVTAAQIREWLGEGQHELWVRDWRCRVEGSFPKNHSAFLLSFDPNKFDLNPSSGIGKPEDLRPEDLELIRDISAKLPSVPIVVQLSTYALGSAKNLDEIATAVSAGMRTTPVEIRAGRKMMSMVFPRNLPDDQVHQLGQLGDRFKKWLNGLSATQSR